MQTAHEIVARFIASKAIEITDFHQWFQDGGYSQCEADVHDTRYLDLLEQYAEERDGDPAVRLPRKPVPDAGRLAGQQNFLRTRRSYPLSNRVEHFVYFANAMAANSFVDAAAADGFSIGAEKHQIGTLLLIMVYTRNHNPAGEITRIAEECGGTYDGSGFYMH